MFVFFKMGNSGLNLNFEKDKKRRALSEKPFGFDGVFVGQVKTIEA